MVVMFEAGYVDAAGHEVVLDTFECDVDHLDAGWDRVNACAVFEKHPETGYQKVTTP